VSLRRGSVVSGDSRRRPARPTDLSRPILIQRPETPEPESIQADNGQRPRVLL